MAGACIVVNQQVLEIARSWIGTPYQHQASCRGAGTDCLGLLRGIWRELYGTEPEIVPPYTMDWSEIGDSETLLDACARHLLPVAEALAGDVLVLRMRDGAVAKHLAIRSGHKTIIHAYSGHGVVHSTFDRTWSLKVAGIFRFPDRSA